MLTQVMNNLLPGFRVVLGSICDKPYADNPMSKINVTVQYKNEIFQERHFIETFSIFQKVNGQLN